MKLVIQVEAIEKFDTIFAHKEQRECSLFSKSQIIDFLEDTLLDIKRMVEGSINIQKSEEARQLTAS